MSSSLRLVAQILGLSSSIPNGPAQPLSSSERRRLSYSFLHDRQHLYILPPTSLSSPLGSCRITLLAPRALGIRGISKRGPQRVLPLSAATRVRIISKPVSQTS